MLRVRTVPKPSVIEGIGVFAAEDIPEGAEVWRFDENLDFKITQDVVSQLDGGGGRVGFFYRVCYINPENPRVLVICIDNARFLNFASPANLKLSEVRDCGEQRLVAARFIRRTEELTVPPESDADYARKMNLV